MPTVGGTDSQPALFEEIMATISSALQAEDEYDKGERARLKGIVDKSKANVGAQQGHQYMTPPKR